MHQLPGIGSCPGAAAGVLVVHGIGLQHPGDTLDEYGLPIAEVWARFGLPAGVESDRTLSRCDEGHIHLRRGAHQVAAIDEAYWADEVGLEPGAGDVLLWGAFIAPYSVLHLMWRLPRNNGSVLRLLLGMAFWPVRFMLGPFVVVLVQVACGLAAPLMVVASRLDRSSPVPQAVSGVLGDAYSFVTDPEVRTACARSVTGAAIALDEHCDSLVVVAHSQGAAVTLESVGAESWPTSQTSSFVSIGSGFNRLAMLERLVVKPVSKLVAALLAIGCWVYAIVMLLPESYEAGDGPLGVAIIALCILIPLQIVRSRRGTRSWADKRLASVELDWLDVWSTHDLVPDGPAGSQESTSLRVENERSVVRDHTAYARNPAEVLVPIIRTFDERRFEGLEPVIQEIVERRRRRFRIQALIAVPLAVVAWVIVVVVTPESMWWFSFVVLGLLAIPFDMVRGRTARTAAETESLGALRQAPPVTSSLPPPPPRPPPSVSTG